MENNPYSRMLSGEPLPAVLKRVASSGQTDFEREASQLGGAAITNFGIHASRGIRLIGIESVVGTGFMLDLHRQLTSRKGCEQLFDNLLDDVGISRTQAYRAIAVWQKCGFRLVKSPELIQMFVAEALKLLSALDVPESARDEAFDMARRGERIHIKTARQICERHGAKASRAVADKEDARVHVENPVAVAKAEQSSLRNRKTSICSYVGSVVRLIVEPRLPKSRAALADVISDLESLLARLRLQHEKSAKPQDLTTAG